MSLGEVDGFSVPEPADLRDAMIYAGKEEDPLKLAEAQEGRFPNGWDGWITVDGDNDPRRPLSRGPASFATKDIGPWIEERLQNAFGGSHGVDLVDREFRTSPSGKGWHLRFRARVDGSWASVSNVFRLRLALGDDETRVSYDARRVHLDPASIGGWLSDANQYPKQGRGGLTVYEWGRAGEWVPS